MFDIAIIINTLSFGGAEKQAVFLAKEMCKKFHVHFFILDGKKVEERLRKELIRPNITLYYLRSGFFFKCFYIYNLLKFKKINIIFSFLATSNFVAAISGNFAGVEGIYMSIRSARVSLKKRFIQKFLNNYLTSGTVFNNFTGRVKMIQYGFKAHKSYVIQNCIPVPPKKLKLNVNSDKVKVCSLGRFIPVKNFNMALNIIKRVINEKRNIKIEYNLVGYGEQELLLRQTAKDLGINTQVNFIINPENPTDYFYDSDIFLATSLHEGTPNAVMEAMAAGLPVVATNAGDSKYLVEHGVTGYIAEIDDINSMVNYLGDLIDSPEMRSQMGNAGYFKIKEEFSVERFQKQYLDLISKDEQKVKNRSYWGKRFPCLGRSSKG